MQKGRPTQVLPWETCSFLFTVFFFLFLFPFSFLLFTFYFP
jgi:hypothetical protein